MSSAAQIAANRTNSKLSTGPATEIGQATSKMNGLKTGLTGRTVVLPSDDLAAYQAHLEGFQKKFDPATDEEHTLVQSLADTEWRLTRIPSLEINIYALGRLEFAGLFEDQSEDVRKSLIEAKIYLVYQRQLSNLGIQEKRLRHQRDEDKARLSSMQHHRRNSMQKRLSNAAHELIHCMYHKMQFDSTPFGFEFTAEQIERRAAAIEPNSFPHIKLTRAEQMAR
ncbi:MAG: hypothetical protein M3Y57_07260 [Acidobacteriota bacterium]|nr:hypothetical protein [Acidobacteriota bacterium]